MTDYAATATIRCDRCRAEIGVWAYPEFVGRLMRYAVAHHRCAPCPEYLADQPTLTCQLWRNHLGQHQTEADDGIRYTWGRGGPLTINVPEPQP